MPRVRTVLLAPMIGACVALGGCSWIVIDGPPSGHATMASFECDEARWPAWLDLTVAGLAIVGAATAQDDPDDEWFGISAGTKIVGNSVIALVSGASAVTGFRRTASCREAREALIERAGR